VNMIDKRSVERVASVSMRDRFPPLIVIFVSEYGSEDEH